ncbi:MAG: CotH kinase family protein [Bacilli bacterium]|nr:CotH kinase family protein [Bacilli bacterium]
MKYKKLLEVFLIVLMFVIMIALIVCTSVFNKFQNSGKLIINEIMASNKTSIKDKNGNYYDYIELYNGYNYDINLEGYYLSDDNYETKKWSFPDITIKSKSYLVVFASGLNYYDKDEIHTNFKLNTNGEVVTLSDTNAKAISKIYYSNTASDTAYGYNGKKYVYYYLGSPNKSNSGSYSKEPINLENSTEDIRITEYMLENISAVKSKDGSYYSVIELYNNEKHDINLEGYFLSDNIDNITKYTFPKVTIKAKSYLVIYASSKDTHIDGELHTNFELNNKDNILILSDNRKKQIDKVDLKNTGVNLSYGYYSDSWQLYSTNTFGEENSSSYIKNMNVAKSIQINEVSAVGVEGVELKNLTNNDINLSNYSIGDKSGTMTSLPDIVLKANSFITLYGSDYYSYHNGIIYLGFHINNSNEEIYLYKDNILIDYFEVGRMVNGGSSGINNKNEKVYYKMPTFGKENSADYYYGYSSEPKFSINGGYVEKGTKVTLSSETGNNIYYTLDGSFPTVNSQKYSGPITINKTTVIKAIAYKEGNIESEIISRTFIVGRKHDVAIVSISTNDSNFFGANGILTNYQQDTTRKISFEFYERDGSLGTSFLGDTKLSGMDSREQPQKSMTIYLRKQYGKQEVTYPFFEDSETNTYSSLLLRNAGEDPKRIRIMDAVLTRTLKGQMDIDMQDYRPVVVYINGVYYGLYNLRDKLNGDYVQSKYGINKDNIDLIKYTTATKGDVTAYNDLINYVRNNDPANSYAYEYLKTQIDMQELCNYWVVQTYYGNTDLGNIRYWRDKNNGKWRYMIYDLDWSMWNSNLSVGYTTKDSGIPAATYLSSSIYLVRRLSRNSEFRDMYLKTFAYHLENTFNPIRMNSIVDELAKEIESEMPYHIQRWGYPSSINTWYYNLNSFKNMINARYYKVLNRLKGDFDLSNEEYNYYFGAVK